MFRQAVILLTNYILARHRSVGHHLIHIAGKRNPALALDHRAPGDEDAQQVPERVLRRGDARVGVVALLHLMRLGVRISTIGKMILQIFGGLVLGCIKSKFCKKICV